MAACKTTRKKTFNMRVSPDEWRRFEAVAEYYGLTVAATIRMLVKREAAKER